MKARMEHFPAKNPNPVLSVEKDGTVLYSNEAAKPLLIEWGVETGEKLPSHIGDIVEGVLCRNRPEKMEIKAGKKVYLVTFQSLLEEECVNIYGFDISDQKVLEEKLRESEEKYRIVADNTFDWEFWEGPDGRFLYISPFCEPATGYAVREFMDNPDLLREIIHSDDRQAFLQYKHDASPGHHSDIEFRIITKDGEIRWFHHLCHPIYDGKGCYAGSRGSNRDITERKQEEQRVRRYNRILEGINWIFSNVVQAKTEEELGEACLSIALEVTGSEFGFIIEMGADGLLHDVAKSELAWERCRMYDGTGHLYLPRDYPVHGLYGSVIINGKSFFTNDPQSHPDSRGLPEGHPLLRSFLGVPLVQDGKTIGSIAVANREGGYNHEQQEDLEAIAPAVAQVLQRRKVEQERKLAEKELKASELRFKALVQDLESGVVLIDAEGKFAIYNPALLQIFDISEQELEHMKIQDLNWDMWDVVDKDGNALRFESHPIQYARISRKPLKNQVIGVRRYSHEDWVWTLVSSEPLLNPDGSINIIICTFTDITQLKNTEDALKIANETLEEKVKERTAELEKAYISLKESEKGLAEAQRMAHIGNWDWDFVTGEVYWSDEMFHIFGLAPQKFGLPYNDVLNYIHPDDRDYVDNAVKEAFKGKPYNVDYRIVLADGAERIVHTHGEFFFNEENTPVKIKGIVQDITERKKSEKEIRNLANIVESSNDAIGTVSLNGIITSWNKGAEQVYGYSAEEILGKTTSVLAPPHLSEETKKLTEKVMKGERIHIYETSRLRKDGTIINVSVTFSPVFDASGKLTAVSVIARDITERKRVEEKLRESEEKYRNIVETANEGILIIDDEYIITYVNKKMADMLGYTLEEGIGRSVWDFVDEESKIIIKKNIDKKLQGTNESYELRLICKDGSPLWSLINAKSLFDNDGKFMGTVSMITDITKRKKAEEALKRMDKVRIKEIHHRIKNNLQIISSLLDLQAEKFEDENVIEAFREGQNRVISMSLIHEELYKGEGTDTLDFSAYLKKLAENLFQTYNLSSKNINLSMDLEKDTFLDMDTAVPLGIIVNELVSNSLKHAFTEIQDGEIRIQLFRERENREMHMSLFSLIIYDNGKGLPEDLDLESAGSLGLQLVGILVDQLDGELELKRTQGTEFTIKFKVEKDNLAQVGLKLQENG
ncbi:PAS domain S-box protein [Methanosarcina siciliae]|nr:PAS domain S-box protein [Methanosarcina siciliae]